MQTWILSNISLSSNQILLNILDWAILLELETNQTQIKILFQLIE